MSDRFWLQDMIDVAEAAGEQVPAGVYLIGNREPTPVEIEYGLALIPLARWCLGSEEGQMKAEKCPMCDKDVSPEWSYCGWCGARIDGNVTAKLGNVLSPDFWDYCQKTAVRRPIESM